MTSNDENGAHSVLSDSSNGAEYAQDWIDFLKKRNRTLTIVWVILLLITIALFVVASMQFMRANESDSQLLALRQDISSLESQIALERASLSKAKTNEATLVHQLETLKIQNMEYIGESDAQLNLSDKLVAALKEKIGVLEEENNLVADVVEKNKVQHQRMSKDSAALKKDLKNTKENLSSRTLAYKALVNRHRETKAEMERLAQELDHTAQRENTLDRRNAELSDDVKQLTRKASDYEARTLSLEKQLKAITSPIEMTAPTKRKQTHSLIANPVRLEKSIPSAATDTMSESNSPNLQGGEADEEKKPKPSIAPSPLDFDSISIDRS